MFRVNIFRKVTSHFQCRLNRSIADAKFAIVIDFDKLMIDIHNAAKWITLLVLLVLQEGRKEGRVIEERKKDRREEREKGIEGGGSADPSQVIFQGSNGRMEGTNCINSL